MYVSDTVFGLEDIHHHSLQQNCDAPPPDCIGHSCTWRSISPDYLVLRTAQVLSM